MLRLEVIVVLGLAAFRATRLVTADTILLPFRTRLYGWAWADPGTPEWVLLAGHDDPDPDAALARAPWRSYVYELFTCGWCVGMWASAAVLGLFLVATGRSIDVAGFLVALGAVAGVQGIVTLAVARVSD